MDAKKMIAGTLKILREQAESQIDFHRNEMKRISRMLDLVEQLVKEYEHSRNVPKFPRTRVTLPIFLRKKK